VFSLEKMFQAKLRPEPTQVELLMLLHLMRRFIALKLSVCDAEKKFYDIDTSGCYHNTFTAVINFVW
jgi:hypothetical protein